MADGGGAVFGIDIKGNAREVSRETASALEDLRSKFKGAEDRSRELTASLRGLSGKSAEVTAAKAELKAALAAEKTKMNEASLAIQKQGFSYGQLAAKAKATGHDTKGLGEVVKGMGGPLGQAQGKLAGLKEMLSGASMAEIGLAAGASMAVAAVVAFTAAIIAGGVAFAKWVLTGADAARTMQLWREGAVRATGNAANLGTQVDALARKVPIAKSELNAMAVDIYRAFNNTATSGTAIVDVMDIVSQATAAAGSDVGKAFQGILERGKQWNRMQLNPLELQGTGITFQDVAGELAKQLHIGVKDAQLALMQGRVTLDAGAKAMAAAVNARFGELNARKMLSFDNLVMKFHESLADLTSGVKIEPLGKAIKSLFDAFDQSTASGRALKTLVEVVGNGLVKGLVAAAPLIRGLMLGAGIAALDLGIAVLKTAAWIKKTLGIDGSTSLLTFENAVTAGKVAVYGLAAGLAVAAIATAIMTAPLWLAAAAFYGVYKAEQFLLGGLKMIGSGMAEIAVDAVSWGGAIVDGLVGGITSKWAAAKAAVNELASGVSDAFKDALGISSPSKLFAEHGGNIVAGLTQGLDAGRGAVQDSASGLAPDGPTFGGGRAGGGTSAGGGGKIELHVHIDAPGATAATVQAMSAPPFLAQLTHEIERLLQASGVLTQAGAT